jgi:hypothetical protein
VAQTKHLDSESLTTMDGEMSHNLIDKLYFSKSR